MSKQKIYFRADASAQIGYGHFIRTLALADILKNDFDCTFFTQAPTDYQKAEVDKVCNLVQLPSDDSKFDIFLSYLDGSEFVVLDNYFYTTEYQQKIRERGCRLFSIVDQPDKHYVSDYVINHALGTDIHDYQLEPYTQACFGLDYALLRTPFLNNSIQNNRKNNDVLICFGGSDYQGITIKCVEAAIEISEIDNINVIVGDAYQDKDNLFTLANLNSRIKIFSSISAQEMADLMSSNKLACLPASSVLWEAIFCNLNIVYGYYIDNQTDICKKNGNNPSCKLNYIGDWRVVSKQQIKTAIRNTISHISDTAFEHSFNVKYNFISLFNNSIQVRLANENDMKLYYEWANDKDVRAMAFHSEPISWENHQAWFNRRLNDRESCLCIAFVGNNPIGQVRFDKTEDSSYEIDISIAKEQRGKGYGKKMLMACMEYAQINCGISTFSSEVKVENTASNAMFIAAGFEKKETKDNINYYQFNY